MAEIALKGNMKVKTLKADFKKAFGATLRVYKSATCKGAFADDDATQASIRAEGKAGGELEIRGRFDAVSKAVALRAKDLMKISSGQAAFLAQKDQPGGKKTMKAYLWKVCGDEWDAAHGN